MKLYTIVNCWVPLLKVLKVFGTKNSLHKKQHFKILPVLVDKTEVFLMEVPSGPLKHTKWQTISISSLDLELYFQLYIPALADVNTT